MKDAKWGGTGTAKAGDVVQRLPVFLAMLLVLVLFFLLQAWEVQRRYIASVQLDESEIILHESLQLHSSKQDLSSDPRPTRPLLSSDMQDKPYLILHYGPAKTGTSTLQSELTAWKDSLWQLDRVLYAGAYYDSNTTQFLGRLPWHNALLDPRHACTPHLVQARQTWQKQADKTTKLHNDETLTQHLRRVPCFQPVVEALNELRINGTKAVILSNEVKSTASAWKKFSSSADGIDNYYHVVSQDWYSWKAVFGSDWNVVLVVGYRPYLDWLPSAKTQVDKFTPSKPRLARWPQDGGGRLRTLFPENTLVGPPETLWNVTDVQLEQVQRQSPSPQTEVWKRHWDQNAHPFVTSHFIHAMSHEYVSIRLLPLYDVLPIRTKFLCHTLFELAPKACQMSQQFDRDAGGAALAHVNDGKMVEEHIWYDQLATVAVDGNLISATAISRAKLTLACRQYHQTVLNRTSVLDLPHKCPDATSLLALYRLSWTMEQEMLGNAANATLHASIFRRNLGAGRYCNLNAEQTLQLPEWQSFFNHSRQKIKSESARF